MLDTRDLQEEIEVLEAPSDDHWSREEERRYTALIELREELGEVAFRDGDAGPLIPVDDWEDYARELAEDIGAIDPDAAWPLNHIDWEAAAETLLVDYTETRFDGKLYYYRAV